MVLIFDLYTLDKVCEMDVNVCNEQIKEYDHYVEHNDKRAPEYADMYATADDFPKIQNWNGGEYILVGVGADHNSKMFYEFRIYDSSEKKMIGKFDRTHHEEMEGLLLEAEFHKEEPETLIFLMVQDNITMVVEADIMENEAE